MTIILVCINDVNILLINHTSDKIYIIMYLTNKQQYNLTY